MEGQCQCGQIKFTTPTDKPSEIYYCHCWECRHQASGPFGMTATFQHFRIQPPFEGALSYYDRPNPSGTTRGWFCAKCGSRIIHEHLSASGEPTAMLSVKAGCLDGLGAQDYRKGIHIWTKSGVIDIPEGVEAHEGEPEGGSFGEG